MSAAQSPTEEQLFEAHVVPLAHAPPLEVPQKPPWQMPELHCPAALQTVPLASFMQEPAVHVPDTH